MTNAPIAIQYCHRGLAVFPLVPGSKRPIDKGGLNTASADSRVASARWAERPDAGIGIRTGPASGLWVVDVDGAEGRASLARLEMEHGALPVTAIVETPGGGLHLYWRWAGLPIKSSQSKIGAHIDVLAEGRAATAPPSVHPNGGRYRWAKNGATAFADAPGWLVQAVAPPPQPRPSLETPPRSIVRYVAAAASRELLQLERATEGARNHALNRAAFSLAGFVRSNALPEAWTREQLETRARALGLPLPEVRDTIASAFSAAQPREIPS